MFVKVIKWWLPSGLLRAYGNWRTQRSETKRRQKTAKLIEQYFAGQPPFKLQLGCGPNLMAGWLNTDYDDRDERVAFLDCTLPFELPDERFDYVFTEHLIEHLQYEQGRGMLNEVYRVLKPGGRMRITTPNFHFLIELSCDSLHAVQKDYLRWCAEQWPAVKAPEAVFVVNNFFRDWGHQFIYTPELMIKTLEEIGFKNCRCYKPCQSDDPVLKGLEKHGTLIGDQYNELESFSVEAEK